MPSKISEPINSLCASCYKKCKQNESALILVCPFYDPYPVQLELKLKGYRKKQAKKAVEQCE